LRREAVVELVRDLRERGVDLERRARRESVTARPEQLVDIGVMTVVAPFKWGDVVSLRKPRIKRPVRTGTANAGTANAGTAST
jgi:hypothetical protein